MESYDTDPRTPHEDRQRPEFHRSAPVDPVEKLIKDLGQEGALAQINENLEKNPDDAEARRQANLAKTLLEKELKNLNDKLLH